MKSLKNMILGLVVGVGIGYMALIPQHSTLTQENNALQSQYDSLVALTQDYQAKTDSLTKASQKEQTAKENALEQMAFLQDDYNQVKAENVSLKKDYAKQEELINKVQKYQQKLANHIFDETIDFKDHHEQNIAYNFMYGPLSQEKIDSALVARDKKLDAGIKTLGKSFE